MPDVVVIGAGHNGLVAATLLAKAGLSVQVLEAAPVIGGACRTERPFQRAPELPASTGAYLLGPIPPELMAALDIELPLIRRDPHYFLPTMDGRYLLLGSDQDSQGAFFNEADTQAANALGAELTAFRDDLAPAWLTEPLTVSETAERYIRPELRQKFENLVHGSAIDYLSGFGFASELVLALYAVTDGMPGLTGSPWSEGSGHNFLVHNMCRLPGSDGTWMAVRGGMGTVTETLAQAATIAGTTIRTSTPAAHIAGTTVVTESGDEISARAILIATDVYRIPGLLGELCPPELATRVDNYATRSAGQTMKINLALSDLPRFAALPEPRGQHGGTVHLLPQPADDGSVLTAIRAAYDAAAAGKLAPLPPVEWYLHPSLSDADGHNSSALFVQGVPHKPTDSDWASEKESYVHRVLSFVEQFAPGLSSLIVDVQALTPPEIESHFGITGGNIFHVDNAISFTDRMPYRTGIDGVYAGAAGCFPAGSVIGAAGHNAARVILDDLGVTSRS